MKRALNEILTLKKRLPFRAYSRVLMYNVLKLDGSDVARVHVFGILSDLTESNIDDSIKQLKEVERYYGIKL